jgi:hypothetical protein
MHRASRQRRRLIATLLAASAIPFGEGGADAAGPAGPHVWAAGEGIRIRRNEIGAPLSRGEGNWIWRPGKPILIAALRGEVAAFQVIIEAGDAPLQGVEVDLSPLEHRGRKSLGAAEAAGGAGAAPSFERFIQHYVEVRVRSRNEQRPLESLGWSPGARPPDEGVLGWVPDALIPVAPRPGGAALEIAPRQNGALWIDVTVPEDAAPGAYAGAVRVTSASHGELARLDLRLEVTDATLPYRPVSFFAFYDPYRIANRLGDATPSGTTASEPQVVQLLHRHHLDALASILTPEDVERIRPALDGSLFTAAHGYDGPGAGVPPAIAALGAYGGLGDPSPEALARVEAIVRRIPEAIQDVFLYAIDEQCDSPRGPGWRRLIRGSRVLDRVRVAHTCHRDPSRQDVDLVLMPSQRFHAGQTRAAREKGMGVWVYNGALPQSGPLMLDAPPTSLLANGWIAASRGVGRWFLWEVGFWHDSNRGGRGPVDPWVVAENFHNQDGDACLGDGLLVYPGAQHGRFATGSLGLPGVLPSMRLKALRRGIQDAGYFALARAAQPGAADAILAGAIPAALDEVDEDAPAAWSSDGGAFAAAREALRALIPRGASLPSARVEQVLAEAATAHEARRAVAAQRRALLGIGLAAACAAVVAAALAVAGYVRRASKNA